MRSQRGPLERHAVYRYDAAPVMTGTTIAPARPRALLSSGEAMIVLLAIAGAGVDAVMLVAFGVLTAAQTGNTILLGVALGQGQWSTGVAAAISVVGFVVGSGAGELLIEGGRTRRRGPPLIPRALVVELLLLILVLTGWRLAGAAAGPGVQDVLVALAATAMGIQSAVALRLHAGPATTYVTGTLATFTTGMVRSLRWTGAEPSQAPARQSEHAPRASQPPWMYGVSWIAYLGGAIVAALLYLGLREAALLLPIAVLGLVVVAAQRKRGAAGAVPADAAAAGDR
jgi:uncharacterized membrane protein YoaK (UPF0700 family)